MNWQRSNLTQLVVWPLDGVCRAPHSHPSGIEEKTPERSDDVSSYLTASCEQLHVRKFPERLPTAIAYYSSLVGVYVHRHWSIERHRKSMDFGREGCCGGPYIAAPPTTSRVQNRVEFVELACDISSSWTGELQARTGISRWYHSLLVPRTIRHVSMYSHL